MNFLDQRLDQLDFGPVHTARLKRMFTDGIRTLNGTVKPVTVRDLIVVSEAEILRQPNIGRKSLIKLKEKLDPHGLHFGMLFAIPPTKKPEKRKPKTKTKPHLTAREFYLRERKTAARERAVIISQLDKIFHAIKRLENMQHHITEVTSAVINDLHRRPLQIAELDPETFERNVDKVARENPKAFDD